VRARDFVCACVKTLRARDFIMVHLDHHIEDSMMERAPECTPASMTLTSPLPTTSPLVAAEGREVEQAGNAGRCDYALVEFVGGKLLKHHKHRVSDALLANERDACLALGSSVDGHVVEGAAGSRDCNIIFVWNATH
jgi:hypothetical protein